MPAERPSRPPPDPIALVLPGDPRGDLEALRDRLVEEIVRSEGSAVASLAKQLTDVLKTLAAMPTGEEKSTVDDLADKRAARRTGTKTSAPAAGSVKRGAGGGRASS